MEQLGVIGHIAIDKVITATGTRTQLGGPPSYISPVAQILGVGIRVATKVGEDLPEEFTRMLLDWGMDVSVFTVHTPTTRFVLDYTRGGRGLAVDGVCADIEPEDVLDLPDEVIIAPIAGEIPWRTLQAVTSRTLALDPQGFIRDIGPDGSIRLKRWLDERLLARLSVFKASVEELGFITGTTDAGRGLARLNELGVGVAIATLGEEGALVQTSDERLSIPVYECDRVDPTGAGDAFLAGFFTEYVRDGDLEWCAAMGAASASAVVETIGPRVEISLDELVERAEGIQEMVRRSGV